MSGEPSGVSGEPRGNLGGTLGSTFLKDFLRDVGGTFGDVGDISRGMSGEPPGPGRDHRPPPSKNPLGSETQFGNNFDPLFEDS